MGRTNGSKNAGDYFGKAPTNNLAQQGGFRRLLAFFAPSHSHQPTDGPSARASSSFLLSWRSTRGPADILTIDQGKQSQSFVKPSLSFAALQLEQRWESEATDVIKAARKEPPSQEEYDCDLQQEWNQARGEEEQARRQQALQLQQLQRQATRPRDEQSKSRRLEYQPTKTRNPEQQHGGHVEVEDEATQRQKRWQNAMQMQQLQRQVSRQREDEQQHKHDRLDYQPWGSPQRVPHQTSKQALLPTPLQQHQQQQQLQRYSTPTKLEYSASARHPPEPPQQQSSENSRELLRLPPCTQRDASGLRLRERAYHVGLQDDSPRSGALASLTASELLDERFAFAEDGDSRGSAQQRLRASMYGTGGAGGDGSEGISGAGSRVGPGGGQARCSIPSPPPAPPAGAAPAPAQALRRDRSLRFPCGSGASNSSAASVASFATASGVSISVSASIDSASPSRRSSANGTIADPGSRRAVLLREAFSGASNMRMSVQRLRTSHSGANGAANDGLRRNVLSTSGAPPPHGADDWEPSLERSKGGQQQNPHPPLPPRDVSCPSLAADRVSNPGLWTSQTNFSARVRADLEARAAEEAAGHRFATGVGNCSAPIPHWQQMLEEASAALQGTGGEGHGLAAVASDMGSSIAREGGGSSSQAALPPRAMARAGTMKDRTSRPVTPAARTGRVLQRAATQPSHKMGEIVRGATDEGYGEESCGEGPPAAAGGASVAAAAGAGPPRAGRRAAPPSMAPSPPPPRGSMGAVPPLLRYSEGNAMQPSQPMGPGGAAVAASLAAGGPTVAYSSPRIAVAERARERCAAGSSSGALTSPLDSPPLPMRSQAATSEPPMSLLSFARKATFTDASPRRPRHSSPQGHSVGAPPGLPPSVPFGMNPAQPAGENISAASLAPAPPACRVSLIGRAAAPVPHVSGVGLSGPYDQILEALRAFPPGASGSRKHMDTEASLGHVSAPVEPAAGGLSGGNLMSRRFADTRLTGNSFGSGSGDSSGGSRGGLSLPPQPREWDTPSASVMMARPSSLKDLTAPR